MVLLWISEEKGGIWVEDARELEGSLRDAKVALRRSLLALSFLEMEGEEEEIRGCFRWRGDSGMDSVHSLVSLWVC